MLLPRSGNTTQERLVNIRRRWPRYSWDYQGQSRWEGWTSDRYLGFGIAAALSAATFLELALLTGRRDFGLPRPAGVLLVLMTVVNAWILDAWISSRTQDDRNLPPWLRIVRPLVLAVPILGLAAVPAWKWIAIARPPWAFRQARVEPCLCLSTSSTHGLLRWQPSARRLVWTYGQRLPWLLTWMIACQILPFLGGLSWLIGSGPQEPRHQNLLLLTSAALHLIAALFGSFYGRRQADPSAPRLRALPWLLLLPGLGILSLAIVHPASFHPREEGLLVQAVHDRRRVETIPRDLFEASTEGIGDAELHRRAFFRLKTLVLVLDAAALSWLTTRFFGWSPGIALTRSVMGIGLLLLPVVAGLLLGTLGLVARWKAFSPALRELGRHALGRYLAVVPTVFSLGLVLGSLLASEDMISAGYLLIAAGFGALVLHIVSIPLIGLVDARVQSDSTVIFWFLLGFEIVILGAILAAGPNASLLRKLEAFLWLTPALSISLFVALGGYLLRPFTLRHLLDARFPLRKRAIVGLTALTAVIPLGGLAIPFWIYAHHRLWPRLERAWANELP